MRNVWVSTLCVASLAGGAAHAALVDFSNIGVGDWASVPAGYQPVPDVSITWTGFLRFGSQANEQDHTMYVNASAPSSNLSTGWNGSETSNSATMTFSTPITIPSVWVTNRDWWEQDVVLKGYTNASDTVAAMTATVDHTQIAYHASGAYAGTWVEVTGLAGVPIQRLDLIGTKNAGTWQVGGALMDDISINPVPEPGMLGAFGFAAAGLLRARRRRA